MAEPTPVCEACGGAAPERLLSGLERVRICAQCGHLLRVGRGARGVRAHAWGGRSEMDAVRLALTYRRVLRRLPPGQPDVLEIGFGAGSLLRRLEDRGARVAGVDADLLETSAAWRPREGRVWIGTIEEAELPGDAFDLILGIHVVEHLTDPRRVFAKCFHALRPGGSVYFITPNADSLGRRWLGARWWNFEDPTHTRFYTRRSLRRFLEDAGFTGYGSARLPLDSLALEVASAARMFAAGDPEHGIMARPAVPALAAAALPLTLLGRALVPGIAPSMEAWAVKPES